MTFTTLHCSLRIYKAGKSARPNDLISSLCHQSGLEGNTPYLFVSLSFTSGRKRRARERMKVARAEEWRLYVRHANRDEIFT